MESKELNFWDYFAVLVKWRRLIVVNFIVVSLIAVAISLVLPKWYLAKASLLPPEDSARSSAITSLLANLPISGISIPGATTSADLFVAILGSRTVAEGVIQKLGLIRVYKSKNMEGAVRTLQEHSSIGITPEGVITVEVEEKDPQLAAGIANAYIAELDRVNKETSVSQAKNKRLFIEGRLDKAKPELEKAENELRQFQEKNKAISLPDQVSAAIERAALLKAEQVTLEIELGVLLKTASFSHPQVKLLQTKISEIQKQMDLLEIGAASEYDTTSSDAAEKSGYYVPFSKVPSVGLELARLIRDLKIQEAIYELLIQQYEQAKIEEAKDTPTVQALDIATPPILKSKPNRKVFVIFLAFLSLFISVSYAFSMEYLRRLEVSRTEEYHKIVGLFSELREDIRRLRSKVKKLAK
jgi:uncharacterized protein involved in exopolysaccharide biosynthesis